MDHESVTRDIGGRWANREIVDEGDSLLMGAELAATGQIIGDVSLWLRSIEHRTGEVGWILHPDFSGHGYATESVHALLHLAFDRLGLHRVVARVDARNDASLRLAARLGMRQEAHLVANEWFKGEWTDEIDFGLLGGEWDAQHRSDAPKWCASPGESRAAPVMG